MNNEYKIYNGFKADVIVDTSSDDTMSALAPSPK